MRLVVLESPYQGDVEKNLTYARACLRDCLMRGEAPLASHLLYTQRGVLDDTVECDRYLGITAGHAWIKYADALVVYEDHGLSDGMKSGIAHAISLGKKVEYRSLHKDRKIN